MTAREVTGFVEMPKGKRNDFAPDTQCWAPHCDRLAERTAPSATIDGAPIGDELAGTPVCSKHHIQLKRDGGFLPPEKERRSKRSPSTPETPLPTYGTDPAPAPPTTDPTPPEPPTPTPPELGVAWLNVCHAYRQSYAASGTDGIVSTRDIVMGIRALRDCGMSTAECVDGLLRQGLEPSLWRKVSGGVAERDELLIACEQARLDTVTPPAKLRVDHPTHKLFGKVANLVSGGVDVWLHGPSGSGKTAMAMQIAEHLGKTFGAVGKLTHESGLSGYIQPHDGQLLRTSFRDCYECDGNSNGALFLFDDADASNPQALAWAHMALSNGQCAFADRMVPQREKFACIFTANTIGHGASANYIRNTQDAATRKRFFFLHMDYDKKLEAKIAGSQ